MDVAPLRTERLDHEVDLVALGARTGLLWVRDRAGLAGAGRHTSLPLRPASQASRDSVRDRLAALAVGDAVGLPGCGAAGFSALPFDPDEEGEVVVAEVTVGRSEDGVRFITFPADRSAAEAWDLVQERLAGPRPAAQPSRYELRTPMTAATWCERLEAVRDRIAAGELDKVVLAREAVIDTDVPIDPARVLTHLAATFPSAILFLVDGFCGASPELLVSRRGDLVRSHPLAGTAPRSSDPAVDARLAARLLASDKDRWEHQITIDAALDLLLPFCSYADAEPEPTVVRLANVQHLGTLVEGRLSAPPASVLDLVAALHPTPAVGGAPRDDALKVIAEVEGVDRGRYAGPTGWVDAEGNGSFAVSVRSAQLNGSTARLFAGVGVVADSDPVAELEETRSKFSALLGALIRP